MHSPTPSEMEPSSTITVRRSTRTKPIANPLYSRQVFLIESLNRLKSPKVKQKSETVKKKADKIPGRIQLSKSMPNYGEPPETPEKTTIFFDGDENSMTKLSDKEIRVPPLDIQQNFVVTKDVGIMYPIEGAIKPIYFPSESENSGIIVFKSHSRKAVLKISYPKCFVILSGKFLIDQQGVFDMGDFIKAPARSRLGIKYLGDGEGCGKIIFFKSQL